MLPGERDLDAIKKALKASSQPVEDDMEDEPSMSRTRPLHTVLEIDDAGVKTPSANCSAVGLERRSHGSGAWSITPRAEPAASQCHATPVWDEEVEPPAQKSKREAASNGAQPASDAAPVSCLWAAFPFAALNFLSSISWPANGNAAAACALSFE
jgi:hypothetical protein